MNTCPTCGNQVESNQAFCSRCGTTNSGSSTPPLRQEIVITSSSNNKGPLILLILVLILVIGIISLVMLNDDKNNSDKEKTTIKTTVTTTSSTTTSTTSSTTSKNSFVTTTKSNFDSFELYGYKFDIPSSYGFRISKEDNYYVLYQPLDRIQIMLTLLTGSIDIYKLGMDQSIQLLRDQGATNISHEVGSFFNRKSIEISYVYNAINMTEYFIEVDSTMVLQAAAYDVIRVGPDVYESIINDILSNINN